MLTRFRATTITLVALLLASATTSLFLYPLATRPVFRAGDEPIISCARADARAIFPDAATHQRTTFPIVTHLTDRICVELRSNQPDRGVNYLVCYDHKSGRKI